MADQATEIPESMAAVFETTELLGIIWEKVIGWVEGFVALLPNLVVAFLVVMLFGIVARYAGRFARSSIERTQTSAQIASLAGTCVQLGFIAAGIFLALGILDLQKTAMSLLAGVGVVGLALGFAFQDIASNFMSGVIMAVRRPFEIGEIVQTADTTGPIERVTLRATLIRNFSGQRVIIPNKDVLQNPIINYSREGKRRIEIPVGVGYGCDLEVARSTAKNAVADLVGLDPSEEIAVIYTGFGGSSIDLEVRYWIDLSNPETSYLEARSEGIIALKKAFDEAGIEIPFPIRTLDLPPGLNLASEAAEAS